MLQNQAEAQVALMSLAAFAAGVPPDQAGTVWTDSCPQLQHPAAQLWSQEAAWPKRAMQLWPQPAAEVGLAQSQVASHQGLPSWSTLHMQLFRQQNHHDVDSETPEDYNAAFPMIHCNMQQSDLSGDSTWAIGGLLVIHRL